MRSQSIGQSDPRCLYPELIAWSEPEVDVPTKNRKVYTYIHGAWTLPCIRVIIISLISIMNHSIHPVFTVSQFTPSLWIWFDAVHDAWFMVLLRSIIMWCSNWQRGFSLSISRMSLLLYCWRTCAWPTSYMPCFSRRSPQIRESSMTRSKRKRSSRVGSGGGSMRASQALGPLQEVSGARKHLEI